MPRLAKIPGDLLRRQRDAHPHRRAVFHTARFFDGRLIVIDLCALAQIIDDVENGRIGISLGRLSSAFGVNAKTIRDALRRLSWCGYIEPAFVRPEGPEAQIYRVRMPFESRFDHPIPRQPKLSEIAEVPRETAIAQGRLVAVAHDRAKLISRMREEANGERR